MKNISRGNTEFKLKNSSVYDFHALAFHDVFVEGTKCWFCDLNYNGLFEADIELGTLRFIKGLPGDIPGRGALYSGIAKFGDIFIIAPLNADSVLIYNEKTDDLHSIKLEKCEHIEAEKYNIFTQIILQDSVAYLIPGRYPAIVKIDLDTLEVTYLQEWFYDLQKLSEHLDLKNILFSSGLTYDSGMYELICRTEPYVFRISFEDGNYEFVPVDGLKIGVGAVLQFVGSRWYSREGTGIVERVTGENRTNIDLAEFNPENKTYRLFANAEFVYAIPLMTGGYIVQIHNMTYEMTAIPFIDVGKMEDLQGCFPYSSELFCGKEDSEGNVWMSTASGQLVVLDKEHGSVRCMDLIIAKNDKDRFLTEIAKNISINQVEMERPELDLKTWIYCVKGEPE